jgi:hypothetical protein
MSNISFLRLPFSLRYLPNPVSRTLPPTTAVETPSRISIVGLRLGRTAPSSSFPLQRYRRRRGWRGKAHRDGRAAARSTHSQAGNHPPHHSDTSRSVRRDTSGRFVADSHPPGKRAGGIDGTENWTIHPRYQ